MDQCLGHDDDDDAIRAQLTAMMADLLAEDALSADARAPVTLDQEAVGRLSRIDAMQVQAMAQANAARRVALRGQIAAALKRLDDGDYGWCVRCGEAISPARLRHNPAVSLCINCAD